MDSLAQIASDHYGANGLLTKVKQALIDFGPKSTTLTVRQLASFDQFHTRGVLATDDLAIAMGIAPGMSVLDLGCGIGGPARYLASTYGAQVTGIDLSATFIETASYLSRHCGLSDCTTFAVGDALDPQLPKATFDRVVLQHVAMNIADRAALYRAIKQMLKPGGKAGIYDIVAGSRAPYFPAPWAQTQDGSFLLTEAQTRLMLVQEFSVEFWRNDTELVTQWFADVQAGAPAKLSLGTVVGKRHRESTSNLARSLREGRVGVVMAVVAL
jgi:ubiquinone/menaquinone biosynthesis C-methylase UbiE